MIQPPAKKPTEKPASNLRGLRILILSLAVMTVGGGMMLFVYAFSKAHQSLNEGAREACLAEALEVAVEGEVQSMRGLSDNRIEMVVKADGGWRMLEVDRCSGDVLTSQAVTLTDPSQSQIP